MNKTIQQDDKIMKMLEVVDIRRVICNTNKGVLEVMIRKGDTKYFLTLDSVPLAKELNKELMDTLFPIKQSEVPQVNKGFFISSDKATLTSTPPMAIATSTIISPPVRKGGRPKGSKNANNKAEKSS